METATTLKDEMLVIRLEAYKKARLRQLAKLRKMSMGKLVRSFISEGLEKES